MVSGGKFTYYFANNGEKGVTILKIVTPKWPKPSKLSHLSQNCHTLFRANDVPSCPKFIHKQNAYGRTDPFHCRDAPVAHHHLLRSLCRDVDMVPCALGAGPAWQIILRNKSNINNQVNPND